MSDLEEVRWQAVNTRDVVADGLFVYAVKTTGIYCRPACGSRRPLRKNVEFFATSAEAVATGYRACRRCHPDRLQVEDPSLAAVVAVCRWLENPDDLSDVSDLAGRVGWSQRHLRRAFKEVTGVTMSAYSRAQQAERVRASLRAGTPVTEAFYDAGYGSSRAFYDHGAPRLGTTPDSYRRGSPGIAISYTTIGTELGRILIASTDRGVCAVRIGADDDQLLTGIHLEFARAEITRDDQSLEVVAQVVAELAAGRTASVVDVPLDLQGSAFQVEVWEALRSIEPGQIRTYGKVAHDIGRPTAHRAVANACAANPVALLVPCHRVVRSDGTSGGYRWGADTKAAILHAEATQPRPHLRDVEVPRSDRRVGCGDHAALAVLRTCCGGNPVATESAINAYRDDAVYRFELH